MNWKSIGEVLGVFVAAIGIVTALWKLPPVIRRWWDRRNLLELSGDAYTVDDIQRYTRHYIEPDCQSVDPSGLEDFRAIVPTRVPLFSAMDRILRSPGTMRFLIVLADSGMGKTAFLLNYYARHRRRPWWQTSGVELKLVPLNQPDATEMIAAVPEADRKKTILFLDALDEDQKAIANHRDRLPELIQLSRKFRSVVITCRSQFFPKDEEIPTDTGMITTLPADGSKKVSLQKLYLAPFTDQQVDAYLRRRYPWGRRLEEARSVVKQIPDLVARPLLLTYVEDLTAAKGIQFPFQMYEKVIEKWCERESAFVAPALLREFSECLAEEMFLARGDRQMERIPEADLQPLATRYEIHLKSWQLRGRSLLNRDAAGNYKFSHRSILEYLFVKRFTSGKVPDHTEPWTDLMQRFLIDMLHSPAHLVVPAGTQLRAKLGAAGVVSRISEQDIQYVWIPPRGEGARKGDFWIGQTQVTLAAYRRFAQDTKRDIPQGQKGDDHPVVNVTWHDAAAYCKWAGGRLPADAEWVHAARAGDLKDPYGPPDDVAWHSGNSKGSTHPVAQKLPNAWGLYDMLGNVWEWCEDRYQLGGDVRMLRGGSWVDDRGDVRASFSYRFEPASRSHDIGFRCVRDFP